MRLRTYASFTHPDINTWSCDASSEDQLDIVAVASAISVIQDGEPTVLDNEKWYGATEVSYTKDFGGAFELTD